MFYAIIKYIIDIYAIFIVYFHEFKTQYINNEKHVFFECSNVICINNNENITKQFICNKFEFLDNKIYSFEWIFDNLIYKQYLNRNTLKYLVPYSIYNLRNQSPEHKIIACLLKDNETNEISNITNIIKQVAGPSQNFYRGIYKIYSKDIFRFQNKNLQIITTKSSYNFDLSKDNILEL